MIRIEWPDGTITTPTKGTDMYEVDEIARARMEAALRGDRTIATVASELQAAMDAAARVPKLRAELDGLLGRKRRWAKKGTP